MAKVFADDVILNYTGTEPYVVLINTNVDDSAGNNNGRLDPGETIDLTAVLKNVGGVDFSNLSTTIVCSDPYITILDNSGYFGYIAVDSTKENTSDPYTLSASASTPEGYNVAFKLITVDGSFVDTLDFSLVVGRIHYFVWNPDPTPAPGEAIHSILSSLGYTGNYDISLPTNGELENYYAVFVCAGIYPNNYVIGSSSAEATALVDFLQNQNGRMYLEGGDVWYYDPLYQGGYDFGPLFGINATADGSSDMGPVVGQTNTFTEGMNFSYSGENSWMDHISPTGTGFLIFRDSDNAYDCGVANDVATYQTVGTSFELGGLVDGSGVSTRAALLDSIMHFFGIHLIGVEEQAENSIPSVKLICMPNPCRDRAVIHYQIPTTGREVRLNIYDASGRLVREFNLERDLSTTVSWYGRDDEGKDLPNGVYFVHLRSADFRLVEKVILLR
ncbi:MAG TPA: T9SS type A sorting domain-containing protein [candidate division WOR-3 bacterium]|uniref:T9SS type A sorting domain-containing protein n=1 Tax=candidate division WOR-3 bacterium TaxID=2052148 RepID=A0A9C9JZD7_UNCW3|nr:T9SS type A sorting domain-containing protein [candidate division WOR-3 bacterium]